MLNFIKDYEIPIDGMTDEFKLNTYANFSMELLNLCKIDKKLLTIYEIKEWEGEKQYTEIIEVKDDDGNISTAEKKIKKNVFSYTAILTSNDQTIINGRRKAKKHVRALPRLELNNDKRTTGIDKPLTTSNPPVLPKEPEKPRKPLDHTESTISNKS